MPRQMEQNGSTAWLCVLCAFIAGTYASGFHILNNIQMFSVGAMMIVAAVFLLPILGAVICALVALSLLRRQNWNVALTAGLSIAWVLTLVLYPALRDEFLEHHFWHLNSFVNRLLIIVLFPALLGALLFRKNIRNLTLVLAAMLIAAFVSNLGSVSNRFSNSELYDPRNPDYNDTWFKPKTSPNIYFILADGLTSFSQLDNTGFRTNHFRNFLSQKSFSVYEDTFANIHGTPYSLASMLNFRLVTKPNEEQAFLEIAKPSELQHNLKDAGYALEYLHEGDYLLLRGCSADHCFPAMGARKEANEMLSSKQNEF